MGQLIVATAGAVAGGILGGPAGAQLGWAIGSALGGSMFPPPVQKNRQPIMDLKVAGTEYGQPIPYARGTVGIAGQVWWNSDRILHQQTEKSSAGGKGGSKQKVETTTNTYTINMLIGLTNIPLLAITRIWIEGKLIWSVAEAGGSGSGDLTPLNEEWERLTVYTGDAAQLPDPTYEAAVGAGNAPAYRGRGSVFIEELQLGQSGRVPNITFEVVVDGTSTDYLFNEYDFEVGMSVPLYVPDCDIVYVSSTDELWVVDARYNYNWPNDDNKCRIMIFDRATEAWVGSVDFPDVTRAPFGTEGASTTRFWYVPEWDVVMLACRGAIDGNTAVYNPQTRTLNGTYYDLAAFASRYPFGAAAIALDIPRKRMFTARGVYTYTVWQLDDTTLLPITELGYEFINDNFALLGIGVDSCDNDGNFWYPTDPGTDGTGTWARSWQKMNRATGYSRTHLALDADLIGYSGGSNPHDICFDPVRNAIYYWSADRTKLKKLDCSGESISTVGTYVPPASGGPAGVKIFYDSDRDRIAAISASASTQGNIWWIVPDDGTIEETLALPATTGSHFYSGGLAFVPGYALWGSGSGATTSHIDELLFGQVTPTAPTVQEVVSDLCLRAGLTAGQIDVTALSSITRPVKSIAVSQIDSTRSVIELLASVYFFEMTTAGKLKFVPRGGAVAATIPYLDLGASTSSEPTEPIALHEVNELEIPAQIALTYINIDNDYQTDTQNSDRITSVVSGTVSAIQLAIGMTPSEAKSVADVMLLDQAANRATASIALLGDYCALEPTDPIQVYARDGSVFRMRITQKTDSYPIIKAEVVTDDTSILSSQGITSTDYTSTTTVAGAVVTDILLLDIPILLDSDNDGGFYVAASAVSGTFPGAAIFDSDDNVNYTRQATVLEEAIMGATTTALDDYSGSRVFDEASTVTVSVNGELTSSTRDLVLSSQTVNAMLIGNEIIQFATATLVSPGVYTLSRLLRGARGTEWAMTGHASVERCLLLRPEGIRRIILQNSQLGVERFYKGVTLGRSVSSATGEAFTDTAIGLKPFAPIDFRAARDGSNNITGTFARRSRLAVRMIGTLGISVPLGEDVEAYEIDVYDPSSPPVLVRTISTNTPSFSYSAAEQTADGLVLGNLVDWKVYQISSTVGRGYPLEVTA